MSARELRIEDNRTTEELARTLEALAPELMKQLPASEVQLVGLPIVRMERLLQARARRSPLCAPCVELGANCVDCPPLEVQLTMYRKPLDSLPALYGANVPVQVGRNLLPAAQGSVEPFCRLRSQRAGKSRRGGHDRCYDKERHAVLTQNAACADAILRLASPR
jgi:hypothetical protein